MRKIKSSRLIFGFLTIFLILFFGCKKDDDTKKTGYPVLDNTEFSIITTSFGYCLSEITSIGDSEVTAKGFCWSTFSQPTLDDFVFTHSGSDLVAGDFGGTFSGFELNTKYYMKSWATNSQGTGYGDEIEVVTPSDNILDYDGNLYSSVVIGSQEWMVHNLKVTHYNDGVLIPNITDNSTWEDLTTPAFCWYDNSTTNKEVYGALYNWYAVNTAKLSPEGWHIPSDAEWLTLIDFLGGEAIAGGRLKESGIFHWDIPNVGPGDAYFYAFPGGKRGNSTVADGEFLRMGSDGYWWTSSEEDSDKAKSRNITNGSDFIYDYDNRKEYGLSVKCIRD